MTKKRGLGKGLQALLPPNSQDIGSNNTAKEVVKEIPVSAIKPNPRQPRQVMDQEKLEELMDSIKEFGLVQPIVVRPLKGDGYELIAGERRWRACAALKRETIPAIIKDYGDLEASAAALIENIQRENLNPLEEANAYRRLMVDFGLTQEAVSQWVGKSRPFVGNMVRLLGLPLEVQGMINEGSLAMGHARALLGIKDDGKLLAAAQHIVNKQLNVRQAEDMVRDLAAGENQSEEDKAKRRYKRLPVQEKYLQVLFGTSVRVNTKADGAGRIIIEFSNQSDLGRIMEMMDVIPADSKKSR